MDETGTAGTARKLRHSSKFSRNEIDQALRALAFTGSTKEAKQQCANLGFSVDVSTLRMWKRKYSERYAEIYQQNRADIEATLVTEYQETARAAMEATRLGIEKTREEMEAGTLRDVAGATRNMATTAGIMQDKGDQILGRPTIVRHDRTPSQALESLARRFGGAVDSSAQEIPEAKELES